MLVFFGFNGKITANKVPYQTSNDNFWLAHADHPAIERVLLLHVEAGP